MRAAQRVQRVGLIALLGMVLGLTGCVAVPTAGPVERIGGQQPVCQNCVNVEVAPPEPGDDPGQIVEGYLRATSNFQPGYTVAKQFLSKSALGKWSPEDGVSVFRPTSQVASGNEVQLSGTLVGSLARDRTFTARDQDLEVAFQLVNENGEWRINNPPGGLMVAEYSFRTFYKAYNLYFIGNGVSLVPDAIYLPSLRSPQNVASALITALLNGPSEWLEPAVATAIPTGTTLSVNSVTITDGIADVPLSDNMLALTDSRRSLVAAQIIYTLKQSGIGIKGVVIRVNQQTLRVPEADPKSQVISVDAIPREMEPVSFVAGEQLYGVREGRMQLITSNSDAPNPLPVSGPLGEGQFGMNSLAVSVANTDLAVVTDGRTVLRRAPTTTGKTQTLIDGVTELLRPQFTRYGEIWAIGREAGRQRMWVFDGDQRRAVDAPLLGGGRIVAFKVSPDGAKMALIRKTAAGSELGLARISRADKIMVDGWRTLNTTQSISPRITRMVDVAWIDPNDLLVLGAPNKDAAIAPFRVAGDASQISSEGESDNWDAVEVTVLLRTQTAIIRGGKGGRTWRYDGSNWVAYVDKLTALAYPG